MRILIFSILAFVAPAQQPAQSPALIVPAYNEVHVDDRCRIVTQDQASPGQPYTKPKRRTDDAICHIESVHDTHHWEATIDQGVVKRTYVHIREQTYVLYNPTDQSVTFVVDRSLPAGWVIDSVPQPMEVNSAVVTFRVVGPPGETVRLHVGERH